MNSVEDLVQSSYGGDKIEDLKLALFVMPISRATKVILNVLLVFWCVCVAGPTTFFPIVTLSKKQG